MACALSVFLYTQILLYVPFCLLCVSHRRRLSRLFCSTSHLFNLFVSTTIACMRSNECISLDWIVIPGTDKEMSAWRSDHPCLFS